LFTGFAGLTGCATGAQDGDQPAERRARCPEGRAYSDTFCSQIRTYASDPDTGQCCRYQSPCATPTGWKTFPTETACEEASED
jgi:hypothetical protein